jgi:hypothetical protein
VGVARAVARLIVIAVIVFVVAAAAAAALALVLGGEFERSFGLTAIALGLLLLLMGGTGGVYSRPTDAEARITALGRLPGVPSWIETTRPGEPTIAPSIVFVVSGLALVALGLVVG